MQMAQRITTRRNSVLTVLPHESLHLQEHHGGLLWSKKCGPTSGVGPSKKRISLLQQDRAARCFEKLSPTAVRVGHGWPLDSCPRRMRQRNLDHFSKDPAPCFDCILYMGARRLLASASFDVFPMEIGHCRPLHTVGVGPRDFSMIALQDVEASLQRSIAFHNRDTCRVGWSIRG